MLWLENTNEFVRRHTPINRNPESNSTEWGLSASAFSMHIESRQDYMWEYEHLQDIKDPVVEEDPLNEWNRGAEQEKHYNDVEGRGPGLFLSAKGLHRSNGKGKQV